LLFTHRTNRISASIIFQGSASNVIEMIRHSSGAHGDCYQAVHRWIQSVSEWDFMLRLKLCSVLVEAFAYHQVNFKR
jgi:hypothetical protein